MTPGANVGRLSNEEYAVRRFAAIMAGGSGERFWPLSRRERPKQLLRLTHPEMTMLHEATDRVAPLVGLERTLIATAVHLAGPIREAGLVPAANVIAEPDRRNTLGALAWLAAVLIARGEEASTLAILTADHKIEDPLTFRHDCETAMALAEKTGGLVTLGIPPTRPETGYGYIESAPQDDATMGVNAYPVRSFREKPDRATAEEFLARGTFTWNSGMFFWTLEGFLRELGGVQPLAVEIVREMAARLAKGDERGAAEEFRRLPNVSVDYALMEKAKRVYVVPANFPWDDVGSFDALLRTMPADADGNVVIGEVSAVDCRECILYNEAGEQVLTAVGLSRMILVQTHDAVMAAGLDDAQRVKEIVARLAGSEFV